MKTYEELCSEVEQIEPIKYHLHINAGADRLLVGLADFFGGDKKKVMDYLLKFYVASIYANGKTEPQEISAMQTLLINFFGTNIDAYLIQQEIIKGERKAKYVKELADEIADAIGEADDSLKEELIKISLMICATDGKITPKEKAYIKQLIK